MLNLVLALLAFLLPQQPEKAVIEGVVGTAGTNLPIAEAQVTAFGDAPNERATATANREGRFILRVDPGQYRVMASHPGFVSSNPQTRITLGAGQRFSNPSIRLVQMGSLTGRVFDPEGRPMEGAAVTLSRLVWQLDGRRQMQPVINTRGASTNDLGEYRLYWIPPGEYYLSARDNRGVVMAELGGPSQRYVTTYHPGVADPLQAATVTVTSGVDLKGMDISISRVRSTTVRGRLVSPVADVADSVTIVRMSPIEDSVITDPISVNFNDLNKTFSATSVMPGRYRILAALRIPNKFNLSGETIVDVAEEPVVNATLTVRPGHTLTGRFHLEDSSSALKESLEAERLHVTLRGEPGGAFLSTAGDVKKDGTFVIPDVAIVNYRIGIAGLPIDAYISSARLAGVDILENGFTLRGDPPGPIELSVSALGGRIAGAVRNAQNEMASTAQVFLVPEPPSRARSELFRSTGTDQYGRFNIQSIPPGKYKLFAFADAAPSAYPDPAFILSYEDQGKPISVEKNDYIQLEVQLGKSR